MIIVRKQLQLKNYLMAVGLLQEFPSVSSRFLESVSALPFKFHERNNLKYTYQVYNSA